MDFTLQQLIYADAAAEFANFTDAARHLDVSQASISAAVSLLERRIGAKLYHRHSSRGVTLTPLGEDFIHEVRVLLGHVRKFQAVAVGLSAGRIGELRIGCQVAIAIRFLPALLDGFGRSFPAMTLAVKEENERDNVIAALLAGKIEFGIGIGHAMDDRIVSGEVAALPPYAIIAVNHPSAKRKSIRLADLIDEPFLQSVSPESRRYVRGLFKSLNAEPRVAYRSNSPDLIRAMASRGLGFAIENIVPATTVSHDGHRFAVVPFADRLPPLQVMTYHRKSDTANAAVRVFDNYVREAFPAPNGSRSP
ncbi:LysR family transcriptional regulator [Bradyrhizobium sp.]|jgi:DNA-binding transcriptional LysR family regulator|uniref:LysR family transcriptional regulator n=1 Tax=Bradyrhizobium sp. TaxID=376 RepID=UPI003C299974